jgi:hypothetical protein
MAYMFTTDTDHSTGPIEKLLKFVKKAGLSNPLKFDVCQAEHDEI